MTQYRVYTGIIDNLGHNAIFVFGSDPSGKHNKGTALIAKNKFGSEEGHGRGLKGNSYGLITMNIVPDFVEDDVIYREIGKCSLTKSQIVDNIKELYILAGCMPNLCFFVAYTKDGSDHDGYSSKDMAKMFGHTRDIPDNIIFEDKFFKMVFNVNNIVEHKDNEIRFYSKIKKYKEFSNMYPSHIEHMGVRYESSENYYQANKYKHIPWLFDIIRSVSPKTSKAVANLTADRYSSEDDRELVKNVRKRLISEGYVLSRIQGTYHFVEFYKCNFIIMFDALYLKFTQNSYLKDLLLSTRDATLIEASPKDYFWGEGSDKTGENNLGKLLMKLRTLLAG
jgi:ribA/ribD-fused uncharacterized protein